MGRWDDGKGGLAHCEGIRPKHRSVEVGAARSATDLCSARLGQSGCDAWTLARIAGHSSTAMSARYVHPSEDAVLFAVERLDGHNSRHTDQKSLTNSASMIDQSP